MYPAGVFGQANHTNPMRNKHTRTKPQSQGRIVFPQIARMNRFLWAFTLFQRKRAPRMEDEVIYSIKVIHTEKQIGLSKGCQRY